MSYSRFFKFSEKTFTCAMMLALTAMIPLSERKGMTFLLFAANFLLLATFLHLQQKKDVKVIQPSGQRLLLDNLSKYLVQVNQAETEKLRKTFENGQCFGLSVCHGAMNAMKKLNWWEAALIEIAKWDGSKISLAKKISLPGSNQNNPISLEKIFERVINYVTFFQGKYVVFSENKFEFGTNKQRKQDALNPKKKIFEMVGNDGKMLTIQHREKIVGKFTKNQLTKFLDEKVLKQSICILSSDRHAISINFQKGRGWMVYDANYPHEDKNSIHKIFASREELIIDDHQTVLDHLARYAFNSAKELLDFIKNEACATSVIIDALTTKDRYEFAGLQKIALIEPRLIPILLDFLKEDKNAVNKITELLTMRHMYGATGLHVIAQSSPQYLLELLEFIKKDESAPAVISKLLTTEDSMGRTGRDAIQSFQPTALAYFEEFANTKSNYSIGYLNRSK